MKELKELKELSEYSNHGVATLQQQFWVPPSKINKLGNSDTFSRTGIRADTKKGSLFGHVFVKATLIFCLTLKFNMPVNDVEKNIFN